MKKEFLAGGITMFIHAGMLLLLFFSMAWHTHKTLPVEVQLWDVEPMPMMSAPPQVAELHLFIPPLETQTPAETPPPSEDTPPEIVLKKNPVKPTKPTPPVPPPKTVVTVSPAAPAITNRNDELKRLKEQSQIANSNFATNPSSADSENAYQKKIGGELRAKVFFDDTVSNTGNPQISIRITLNAVGQVIAVNTIKSSGMPLFDQAVLRGIERLSKFPVDKNGTYPPEVILNYRMHP